MDMVRWNPAADIIRLRDDLSRLFETPFGLARTGAWQPDIEVFETGDSVVVRADLPGIDPHEVDVRVTADTIAIKGQLRRETKDERGGYYHSERRTGSFHRSLTLPAEVQSERAHATYRHGVLEVSIPKSQGDAGRGHRVEVRDVH